MGDAGRFIPMRAADGEAGLDGVVALGDEVPGSQSIPSAPDRLS